MLANRFLATAVLGFLGATTALADGGHRGGGRGHAYGHGHYRYTPAVVSARVVDVEPLVRYVTVNRPREQCWNEVVREPVHPYGVAGVTAAGSVVGAAIGRQFGSGNDRDALTVLGAVAGGAVAHQRAVRNQGTRDVTVQRCEVVNDRVTRGDRRRLRRDLSARRPQLHDADGPASRRLGATRGRRAAGGLSGAVLRARCRAGHWPARFSFGRFLDENRRSTPSCDGDDEQTLHKDASSARASRAS